MTVSLCTDDTEIDVEGPSSQRAARLYETITQTVKKDRRRVVAVTSF